MCAGVRLRLGRFRWVVILVLSTLLSIALTASTGVRRAVLSAAGWTLVGEDPLVNGDVIVVSVAAGGEGVLEAADLFHAGIAPQVAVFADPPDDVDREFLRRRIPYEDEAQRSIRRLRALSVTNTVIIGGGDAVGTEAEGDILPVWCKQNGFHSIVLVAAPDHSRRLRRVMRRSMRGLPVRVHVRVARISKFDPGHWWESRAGARIEIVELQKLLLDIIRHPVS
jgi:hypothetical protein